MKLRLRLLAVAAMTHHADAFSLRMVSNIIPPPLRSVASPPPSSTSSWLRFSPPPESVLSLRLATASARVDSSTSPVSLVDDDAPRKTKTLGLLTFDLDDSLYPIAPVLDDANEIFVQTMSNYGYALEPNDIVEAGKRIREEAGPVAGTAMSHTEVRLGAIRREMERLMLAKKLRECAADWATEVESLTAPVRSSAERWARAAVSQSVVEAIYSAWERERHHSAERHLYPEAAAALQRIREEHPDVVIGAVTDGKANPMLMVFSLAPYFDFCMSWEDDAAGRTEFFKELGNVDGNADLQWIYRAAHEKYQEIAETKKGMEMSLEEGGDGGDAPLWIHVGDDLAYDVGGSASCGAKTILLDLDEEYRQTAKGRFLDNASMPVWNTNSMESLMHRKEMNDAAECMVHKRVRRLSVLPDAIDDILKGE